MGPSPATSTHRSVDAKNKATRRWVREELGEAVFPLMSGGASEAHTAGQRPHFLHLLLCIVSGKETKAGCSAVSDL